MRGGRVLVVVLLLGAAGAGVLWLLRPPPRAEQAVPAAIKTFCDNVGQWRVHEAMAVVSKRYKGDLYSRGDIARGLMQMRTTWKTFRIYVAGVQVIPGGDGKSATALVDVSLTGVQNNGGEEHLGEDKPVRVTSHWELEGRDWRCVSTANTPGVGTEGFY
ncbi:MAG: hypothetical protein HZB16_22300 [Armatimonadetes bacterium]|nr:hypothetical protein [Armatimonadota bacterium]